jgi:hypothetical protein
VGQSGASGFPCAGLSNSVAQDWRFNPGGSLCGFAKAQRRRHEHRSRSDAAESAAGGAQRSDAPYHWRSRDSAKRRLLRLFDGRAEVLADGHRGRRGGGPDAGTQPDGEVSD